MKVGQKEIKIIFSQCQFLGVIQGMKGNIAVSLPSFGWSSMRYARHRVENFLTYQTIVFFSFSLHLLWTLFNYTLGVFFYSFSCVNIFIKQGSYLETESNNQRLLHFNKSCFYDLLKTTHYMLGILVQPLSSGADNDYCLSFNFIKWMF